MQPCRPKCSLNCRAAQARQQGTASPHQQAGHCSEAREHGGGGQCPRQHHAQQAQQVEAHACEQEWSREEGAVDDFTQAGEGTELAGWLLPSGMVYQTLPILSAVPRCGQ